MLQQKKIRFNESNLTVEDVCGLANDDYAFFSLVIDPQLAKKIASLVILFIKFFSHLRRFIMHRCPWSNS